METNIECPVCMKLLRRYADGQIYCSDDLCQFNTATLNDSDSEYQGGKNEGTGLSSND